VKYTRYDFKRKKKDNMVLFIIIMLVVILAFIIGTAISNTFIKNSKAIKPENKTVSNSKYIINNEEDSVKFVSIQCGVYSTLENTGKEINKFNQYGIPFTIQQGKNTKVLLGIYTEEESKKQIQKLKDDNIPVSKIEFVLYKDDLCNAEIAEIINANIKVLNKLLEQNVEAIETQELKKWCKNLKKVNSKSKNIEVLEDLKDYIQKMPKKISKQNVKENYIFLFNILDKLKSS
jgi:hypothetical protein